MGLRQWFAPNVLHKRHPTAASRDTSPSYLSIYHPHIYCPLSYRANSRHQTLLPPPLSSSSSSSSYRTSLFLLLLPLSSFTPHLSLPSYNTTLRSLPLYSCPLLPFSSSLPFSLHIIFPFLPIRALKFVLSDNFLFPKLASQPITNYSNNQSLPSVNMDMLVYFIALSVSLSPPLVLDSRDFPL